MRAQFTVNVGDFGGFLCFSVPVVSTKICICIQAVRCWAWLVPPWVEYGWKNNQYNGGEWLTWAPTIIADGLDAFSRHFTAVAAKTEPSKTLSNYFSCNNEMLPKGVIGNMRFSLNTFSR